METFQFQPIGPISGTTASTIRELLKDGTPDWVSHPEHYRAMAEEDKAMHRENTLRMAAEYAVEDQDLFTDEESRKVNIMHAVDFMRKLRAAGVKCFSHDSQLRNGTAGLHAIVPGDGGAQCTFIATMQVPFMCEWSVIKTDAYGAMTGFKYIGWRDSVLALIRKRVLTEEKAHEIFGPPRGAASRRYRRLLKEFRQTGK
jgi:hypothetical protein